MKRVIVMMLLLTSLLNAGCGGEVTIVASTGNGTIVITTVSAPTIALAAFTQNTFNSSLNGSISFSSPDADLSTMTISVSGMSTDVIDISAYGGMSSGSIPFIISYRGYPPGSYTFTIFVTTRGGRRSNTLSGAFSVP